MPEFDTPEPITVTLEFDIGSARIIASKRTTTLVEILPSDGAAALDVRAAQQTHVVCTGSTLLVKGPRKRTLFGGNGSIDVIIELPTGSHLHGTAPLADFTCEGRIGNCRLKTSLGDIRVDEAATANLRTGHGDIRLDRATGDADITAAGRVDIGQVTGAVTVKNGNGETAVGDVTGNLRISSSNGRISVDTAHASVDAKAARGAIRIGEVARGQVALQSATGDLEVGIRDLTAAWLDVNTRFGTVRNSLGPTEGPGDTDATVEVRARTGVGDIIIRRA
ncbi:DUF4097 family beta strand repeat-containing protein [Streptomyces sp. NPDC006733]|uniref:DUF4097 family beta strand repeat-containing protein n=1 Tax=Streptomyces sp. NPDC006733 TaxID=3155460 RepID=UPI00340D580F